MVQPRQTGIQARGVHKNTIPGPTKKVGSFRPVRTGTGIRRGSALWWDARAQTPDATPRCEYHFQVRARRLGPTTRHLLRRWARRTHLASGGTHHNHVWCAFLKSHARAERKETPRPQRVRCACKNGTRESKGRTPPRLQFAERVATLHPGTQQNHQSPPINRRVSCAESGDYLYRASLAWVQTPHAKPYNCTTTASAAYMHYAALGPAVPRIH